MMVWICYKIKWPLYDDHARHDTWVKEKRKVEEKCENNIKKRTSSESSNIVLQSNSDLGVDNALESTQCFITVSDTKWLLY